ncbi:MAG: hypothetical protein R3E21_10880 [Caenibius sp.]
MTDVVLPALDPKNQLAQEQANLCIRTLQILLSRLPLSFAFDRDELGRLIELAQDLADASAKHSTVAEEIAALSEAAAKGSDVLDRARAVPSELETASFELRAKIGELIPALYNEVELEDLSKVSRLVTENAREQLARDRSWLIGQGWEPDAEAIPAIETLIGE